MSKTNTHTKTFVYFYVTLLIIDTLTPNSVWCLFWGYLRKWHIVAMVTKIYIYILHFRTYLGNNHWSIGTDYVNISSGIFQNEVSFYYCSCLFVFSKSVYQHLNIHYLIENILI